MKKYLISVLCLFVFGLGAYAQDMAKANKLFEDNLFAAALEAYKPLLSSKNKNTRYEAELKTVLSLTRLYKYDEAAKTVYSYKTPSDKLWKTRYQLIKLAALNNLSRYNPSDLVESETDPTKFTNNQLEKAKKDIYEDLWKTRDFLVNQSTENNLDYLFSSYMTRAQLILAPTIFDYLVEYWNASATLPYEQILEQAYKLGGKDREAAAEIWHIKRLALAAQEQNLAQLFAYVSGYTSVFTPGEEVKNYIFQSKEILAKAYAAWQAADNYLSKKDYKQAIDVADYCLKMPLNYFSDSCSSVREGVVREDFAVIKHSFNVPAGEPAALEVEARNLKKFFINLYPLTPKDFERTDYQDYSKNSKKQDAKRYWTQNPYLNAEDIAAKNKPVKTLAISLEYTKKYYPEITKVEVPYISDGLFAVVISKEQNPSQNDKVLFLNFTDTAAAATAFSSYLNNKRVNFFNVYTLDPKTGATKANVQVVTGDNRGFRTAQNGQVKITNENKGGGSLGFVAKNYGNHAIIEPIYFYPQEKEQYIITLNTDRSIYRPGQEVNLQASVIESKGDAYTAYSGKRTLGLTLRDKNYKEIAKGAITLDAMGTGAYTFTLPKELMLGSFSVEADLGGVKNRISASVEEYKQPEFEVSVKSPEGVLTYDKEVELSGNASYYFGSPVAKGKVTYRVNKTYFRPWFCWWWPEAPSREEAFEGTAKLDKNGNFKINFTPKNDAKKTGRPARYIINVFVTDEGGRTITEQKTITVSGQEYFFAMKMDKGFFRAKTPASLNVKMVNADEQPLTGSAAAAIYKAVLPPNYFNDEPAPFYPADAEIKEGDLVTSFPVNFNKEGPSALQIPALEEGYYMLKITAKDSTGKDNDGKLMFIVVNLADPKLKLKNTTLLENSTYYPGETAVAVIASAEVEADKYVEVYHNQFLTEQKTLTRKGIAVLEIPIKEAYQGGLSVNWFAVNNYKSYQGSAEIEVEYLNKKLDIKIDAPKENQPDQAVNWKLSVKDENGKPVNGQALVSVYDKSLDYYKPHSLNIPNPYTARSLGSNPLGTSFNKENLYRDYGLFGTYDSAPMLKSAGRISISKGVQPQTLAMPVAFAKNAMPEAEALSAPAPAKGQPAARSNFAATAFFGPKIPVNNGLGNIAFTLPQRLTEWTALAAVITADVKTGKAQASVKTSKDLILRLEAPRFLREGDKMALKAVLNNNTDMNLPVTVDFTATLNGQQAAELLGVYIPKTEIVVPALSQREVSWNIAAPEGTGIFDITAVARAGGLSDGEKKTFPLLPSKQRLAQSATITVKDGDNTLDSGPAPKDAVIDAAYLKIDPTLLMPVLEAMPMLVKAQNQTVLNLVNSYLPLAIFNKMYEKYPQLQTAAKAAQRTTLTAAWQQQDELLLTELSQSPWYTLSKGYQTEAAAFNIFDAKLVNKQYNNTAKKLADFQNKDGGFAWIQGGKSSSFITLSVLDAMSQAFSYGANIPEDLVQKAVQYAEKEISVAKEPSQDTLSSNLYMAYILSSLPKKWYKTDLANLLAEAKKYDKYLTPVGKAYAAIVQARLGNKEEAAIYTEMLFDGATDNPVTGISWTPEERSWMWYNDSLTMHTAALKLLTETKPEDSRIDGLIQWIIFNKKANMWGNTNTAAKAVYGLIDVMDKKGSFNQVKVFNINWGGTEEKIIARPDDLLSDKFTISKYNAEPSAAIFKAQINKSIISKEGKTSSLNDFASLLTLFTSGAPLKASPKGLLNINKEFFLVQDKGVKKLKDGAMVEIGDEIQVRLTITTQSQFNFVMISDPKPAAFEADSLLSGWKWTDTLPRYEEQRDSLTNFFIDWLPNGAYELKYTIRPTAAGNYNVGAAVMQSMFAPEFAAHSESFRITVK